MYYALFICTIYDSRGVDLYIMCDSNGVYLHVLRTICMYKFSRYHVIIFHTFFFPMTDLLKNLTGFCQNSTGNHQTDLSVKVGDLSVNSADNSVKPT
jgi:hypothetical protein